MEQIETWVDSAVELLNSCETLPEYLKRLTHHPVLGKGMEGNHLFLLHDDGRFRLVAGYGNYPFGDRKDFSPFEDDLFSELNSVPTLPIQNISVQGSERLIQLCPGLKSGIPNGAILTVFNSSVGKPTDFQLDLVQVKTFCLALGLAINYSGLKVSGYGATTSKPEELTSRQLQILHGIARGLTNAQIGSELMLSESAIKQETVKIYKSLGVESRSQAAVKARALALIPSSSN